jgi:hypothetical protein
MVAVRKTEKGVEIDFTSTLFFHEMFLLKGDVLKKELQKLVEEKNSFALFTFLINEIGEKIFYYIS